mgnify:CR=1 FL=1
MNIGKLPACRQAGQRSELINKHNKNPDHRDFCLHISLHFKIKLILLSKKTNFNPLIAQIERKIMSPSEIFVCHALAIKAFRFATEGFFLKCGRLSPYFFDASKFCSGKDLEVLVKAYTSILQGNGLVPETALFGPAYKGTILVPAIALWLYNQYGCNVNYSSCRKERKRHGEGGELIAYDAKGSNFTLLDDGVTTSGTTQKSIVLINNAKSKVKACVFALDRQECNDGDTTRLASQSIQDQFDVPVFSIATLSDLISVLETENSRRSKEFLPRILAYRDKYGIQTK